MSGYGRGAENAVNAGNSNVQKAGKGANRDANKFVRMKLDAWLEEFDLEVESRCRSMKAQADDEALSLKREMDVQLMKLPRKIRQMPLSEFLQKYDGDIVAALKATSTTALPPAAW